MKRPLALVLTIGPLSALGVVAACAESDEAALVVDSGDDAPAVVLPVSDAAVDVLPDVQVDAGAPAPCTGDGWCRIDLPDARAIGLQSYRITGLAMDGASGVYAITNSLTLGAGDGTSHVFHYEQDAWKSIFGIGPQQGGPFPYSLKALATDGVGGFVAVGAPSTFGAAGAVVLRIAGDVVTAEYPDLPHGLVAAAFTSATDLWALDDQGTLYQTSTTGTGPLSWTLVPSPHMPNPDTFSYGPTALFVTTEHELVAAGHVSGTWGDDGFVPGYAYVDRRTADQGWVSNASTLDLGVQAGVASGPGSYWLAVGEQLVQVTRPDDGGANELEWAEGTKLPVSPSAVWARNENDAWAVGAAGRVYRWDGQAWADSKLALNGAPLTTSWLVAITGSATGETWVGGENVALHSTPKVQP